MKTTIIGIEINEGVSKKSGRAYAMGTIHTTFELADAFGEGNVAKGHAGAKLDCPVELLRKLQHLSFPLIAEVERRDVIRFGEVVQQVVDIRPIDVKRVTA